MLVSVPVSITSWGMPPGWMTSPLLCSSCGGKNGFLAIGATVGLRIKSPSSWGWRGMSAMTRERDLGGSPTVFTTGQTWIWLLTFPRDLKPRGYPIDVYSRCDALSVARSTDIYCNLLRANTGQCYIE